MRTTGLHTEVCTTLEKYGEAEDLLVENVAVDTVRISVQGWSLRRLWRSRASRMRHVERMLEARGYRTHRGIATDLFVVTVEHDPQKTS